MPLLKELGAKWLVETFDHIAENPQIIVNGLFRSGIVHALDNKDVNDEDEVNEDGVNDDQVEVYTDEDEIYDDDEESNEVD